MAEQDEGLVKKIVREWAEDLPDNLGIDGGETYFIGNRVEFPKADFDIAEPISTLLSTGQCGNFADPIDSIIGDIVDDLLNDAYEQFVEDHHTELEAEFDDPDSLVDKENLYQILHIEDMDDLANELHTYEEEHLSTGELLFECTLSITESNDKIGIADLEFHLRPVIAKRGIAISSTRSRGWWYEKDIPDIEYLEDVLYNLIEEIESDIYAKEKEDEET